MGMSTGGGKGKTPYPQVNVTPLVDVALVVLIIFMVVTPLAMKTFWVNIPKKSDVPPPPNKERDPSREPLVLTVDNDGTIRIGSESFSREQLPREIPKMLAAKVKSARIVMFDAQNDVSYGTAVEVMDLARAGGARTIAISPKELDFEKFAK